MSWAWARVVGALAVGTLLGTMMCTRRPDCLPERFKALGALGTKRTNPTVDVTIPAPVAAWPPQHRYASASRIQWASANRTNPCVPVAHHLPHRGNFEYHASEMELEWSTIAQKGSICKLAKKQKEQSRIWMKHTTSAFKNKQQPTREPTEEEARVLSYFLYSLADGTTVKRYIEPLHGVARHPLWWCILPDPKGKEKFDLKYLLPENACTGDGKSIKGVFFDLGAGKTLQGFETTDYTEGSGAGPSIPLFYQMYLDRCIDFQQIYAWEIRAIEWSQFWKPLPDHIRARVRFFNNPVLENSCPASPEGNFVERGGFLRMLKAVVSVEDYVVVKVDIDSLGVGNGPELAIVESIAHLPELSELVDELYFEYHFNHDGHNFGWGTGDLGGRDVDTAINLMLRLREAGIRSHFWI